MRNPLGGVRLRETLASLGTGLLGSVLFVLSWLIKGNQALSFGSVTLAATLLFCLILADRFPIHLRYATKVSITSVPLYLMAALLPLPLAVSCAVLGMGVAGILAREERGLMVTDIIFDSARWVIIVCAGGFILSLPIHPEFSSLILVLAALGMFLSDILTFSLYTSFIAIGQSILALVRESLVHSYAIEGIQYMIGLLGVLAFRQAPWSLLLLFLPSVILYFAFKRLKEMQQSTRAILERMADAVDQRDIFTGFHSRRVEKITRMITEQLNIVGAEADLICLAARLHDIGKGEIPLEVLHKPGKLTGDEWALMQLHCEAGARIVSQFADFSRGSRMILYHHERWDGKGYPRGLRGPDIPLGARLIAVADAFDAMTSDRPYRPGLLQAEAIQRLIEGRGTQWDPLIVDNLLICLEKEGENIPLEVAPAAQLQTAEKPN